MGVTGRKQLFIRLENFSILTYDFSFTRFLGACFAEEAFLCKNAKA